MKILATLSTEHEQFLKKAIISEFIIVLRPLTHSVCCVVSWFVNFLNFTCGSSFQNQEKLMDSSMDYFIFSNTHPLLTTDEILRIEFRRQEFSRWTGCHVQTGEKTFFHCFLSCVTRCLIQLSPINSSAPTRYHFTVNSRWMEFSFTIQHLNNTCVSPTWAISQMPLWNDYFEIIFQRINVWRNIFRLRDFVRW